MNLREGQVNPTPSDLVLDAVVDPAVNQTFFLWEEGNMASLPEHLGAEMVSGEDGVGFRPTVVTYPVPEGVQIKGAVLVPRAAPSSSAATGWKASQPRRPWLGSATSRSW